MAGTLTFSWKPHQVTCERCGRTITGGSRQRCPRSDEAWAWCSDCGKWVQVTGIFVHHVRPGQVDAAAEYRDGEGWIDQPIPVAAAAPSID
ncbi:MAG: hypothetical protein M3024_01420, partial [Candidatus Dormibacteraeota bacterium]|nr:hypothetical protein [Candidatus Dormibacteraeota bacterium]